MEIEFLVFRIGDELWAIEVRRVREVVKVRSVTFVPNVPPYIVGVFNLRGQIVTLVSLAKIIGIDGSDSGDKAIVVEDSEEPLALAISDVLGVVRVDQSMLIPPPQEASELISALFRSDGKIVAVLDVDKLYEVLVRS